MGFVLSIAAAVLAVGLLQDKCGSGHSEADLGSERHGVPHQS